MPTARMLHACCLVSRHAVVRPKPIIRRRTTTKPPRLHTTAAAAPAPASTPLMVAVTGLVTDIRSTWGAFNGASSGSVDRLLLSSALSVASAIILTRCISACAQWIDHRFDQTLKRLHTPSSVLASMKMLFCSVAAPLAVYLPTAAALASLTKINEALVLTLERQGLHCVAEANLDTVIDAAVQRGLGGALCVVLWQAQAMLTRLVELVPQLLQVALIALGVSITVCFKQQLVDVVLVRTRRSKQGADRGDAEDAKFAQMLLPVSGLVSWGVALGGAFMALSVLGVNVQPLLAVGGVGGIVLGWSAQSIFGNALSGITLFLTQPFVVGERISLSQGPGEVVQGYVESIAPMFTSVRGDDMMLVSIPNKTVASCVITNESRIALTVVESQYNQPRQLQLELQLDMRDAARLGSVMGQINNHLSNDPQVHKELPFGANVVGLTSEHITLHVVAHTTPEYANKFTMFQTRLVIDLLEIMQNRQPASTHSSTAPAAATSPILASR